MKRKIDFVLGKIMVIIMSILVIDVLWQVISRFLNTFLVKQFNIQVPTVYYSFTDELAGFLLIWVALLGAAYATGTKSHMAIELLQTKLSQRGNEKLSKIINLCIATFSMSVMVIGGSQLVFTRFYLGQVSAAMQIPIGIVYLVVPISGLLITYYVINDTFNSPSKSAR